MKQTLHILFMQKLYDSNNYIYESVQYYFIKLQAYTLHQNKKQTQQKCKGKNFLKFQVNGGQRFSFRALTPLAG